MYSLLVFCLANSLDKVGSGFLCLARRGDE